MDQRDARLVLTRKKDLAWKCWGSVPGCRAGTDSGSRKETGIAGAAVLTGCISFRGRDRKPDEGREVGASQAGRSRAEPGNETKPRRGRLRRGGLFRQAEPTELPHD